jgi:hypothetical protein
MEASYPQEWRCSLAVCLLLQVDRRKEGRHGRKEGSIPCAGEKMDGAACGRRSLNSCCVGMEGIG